MHLPRTILRLPSSSRYFLPAVTILFSTLAAVVLIPPAQAAGNGPAFGHEVIIDNQRVTGEPSISIDGQDRIYVSTPYGFLTTASFVWRSIDGGKTFHLVPGNAPPVGKPLVTCVGGGDSGLAIDTVNNLYFVDLQGLTDVSNSVSSNQGTNWSTTCDAANETGVDRPWIAAYGNPQAGGALYQTVDDVEQCIGVCDQGLGEVGSNVVEITRSQDGVTFTPQPAQQIVLADGVIRPRPGRSAR